jgi:hypothetical protein
MWDEIQDMPGEIFDIDFDFDDVPDEIKKDPDFAVVNDFEDEDSRKALQANAILRGYTLQQVKQASDERLRVMNDPKTRRNRSKLALLAA